MKFRKIPSDIKNEVHHIKCELTGPQIYREDGSVALDRVSSVVVNFSGTLIPLKNKKGYSVRVCGQDGTVYAGNEDQLEAWKDFYLPERMEMVVIGAIDDYPCDAFGLQLVLLLCEDGNIYAYEDEQLHLVATEEEYNEVMESDDIKKMKDAHDEYRESLELELLESFKKFKSTLSRHVDEDTLQSKKKKDCWEIVARKEMPIVPYCPTS